MSTSKTLGQSFERRDLTDHDPDQNSPGLMFIASALGITKMVEEFLDGVVENWLFGSLISKVSYADLTN